MKRELSVFTLFEVLAGRWRYIIAIAALVGGCAAALLELIPPSYVAELIIKTSQTNQDVILARLRDNQLRERALALLPTFRGRPPTVKIRLRQNGVISVLAQGPDPTVLAALANRYPAELQMMFVTTAVQPSSDAARLRGSGLDDKALLKKVKSYCVSDQSRVRQICLHNVSSDVELLRAEQMLKAIGELSAPAVEPPFSVISEAEPPRVPIGPGKAIKVVLSTLVGMFLAVLWFLVRNDRGA